MLAAVDSAEKIAISLLVLSVGLFVLLRSYSQRHNKRRVKSTGKSWRRGAQALPSSHQIPPPRRREREVSTTKRESRAETRLQESFLEEDLPGLRH